MREDDLAALKELYLHTLGWAQRFLEMGEYMKTSKIAISRRSMRPKPP